MLYQGQKFQKKELLLGTFKTVINNFFLVYFDLEASCKDYRAWYGLGQTYEILKMPYYSLYYYNEAYKLRLVSAPLTSSNAYESLAHFMAI